MSPLTLKVLGGSLTVVVDGHAGAFVTVRYDRFEITAKGDHMAYTLPVDKQVQVQVKYVDANGNAAEVDGEVRWESSNEDIARVVPGDDDSTLAAVRPVGPTGQVQITATADADLGEGIRPLITTMDVSIVAGEAVAGTIEPVGEPGPMPRPKK